MKKAFDTTQQSDVDEEGVAQGASSLGADGGPAFRENLIDINDDAWLDEELSDEELAALGEEDFDDEAFLEEADFDEISNEIQLPAPVETSAETSVEADDSALLEDAFAEVDVNESLAQAEEYTFEEPPLTANQEPVDLDYGDAEQASAIVSAPQTQGSSDLIEDEEYDSDVIDYGDVEGDHRPVPRISIHAFCETPAVTEVLEKVAVDRRLSLAHVTMHMGGIAKAVDHFQGAATPNLLLIETVEGGPSLFAQLGALAEVCDPTTKVIIIGRVNDIGLYRELMDQGVSDYLVRPKSPLKVIQTIANLYLDPSAAPIGKTIAFVGARGGVGSSTLAHNVAWSAAEEFDSDTVILDLDLPFGTASLDFEQDPTSGLLEALTSPERLDDVLLERLLQKYTDRLSLFTAPNLLDRDYNIDDQAVETVVEIVRCAAPSIIIDIPHIWTGWAKRLLQTADEIVITAAPDLASFRNAKSMVDVITSARPNDTPPMLILNQYDPKASSVPPEQFAEHVGISPSLIIGWEPTLFHAAATNAAPIFEVGGKTKTAHGLRDLTARVLGREQETRNGGGFSLSRLFKI